MLQGNDLELILDEKMIQGYMRGMLAKFNVAAALKLVKSNGTAVYEDIDNGYAKTGKRISLSGSGKMISSGIDDILFILTCNC